MQATIKLNESEFDYTFFKNLKSLFKGGEFVIKINSENPMKKEDYFRKIEKTIENIERGENLIEYSKEEFEALVTKLSK